MVTQNFGPHEHIGVDFTASDDELLTTVSATSASAVSLVAILRREGRIGKRNLARKTQHMSQGERDYAIGRLLQAGVIRETVRGTKGRPATSYELIGV